MKIIIWNNKIIKLSKTKAKPNKKNITKSEAEKILKSAHDHTEENTKPTQEKAKPKATKSKITKKVSKK